MSACLIVTIEHRAALAYYLRNRYEYRHYRDKGDSWHHHCFNATFSSDGRHAYWFLTSLSTKPSRILAPPDLRRWPRQRGSAGPAKHATAEQVPIYAARRALQVSASALSASFTLSVK